jgi:predicted nucleic acid-binding protein
VIVVDTTPLVALCDPRDALNERALRDLDRLSRQPLITCEPVLTEACFHLPHTTQRERLRRLLETFAVGSYRSNDDARMRLDVFEWLARYAEHEPDWADGYLVILSAHDSRLKLWTYDREFRTIWRRLDGTPVPLATRS